MEQLKDFVRGRSAGASVPADSRVGLDAWHAVTGGIIIVLLTAVWFVPGELSPTSRLTLMVFAAAVAGWTLTPVNDTTVALLAAVALVLLGVVGKSALYNALGHELIWLVIAAFLIAAVLRETGVTQRLALAAVRRARSVTQLAHILTLVIAATAFVIPSTAGRAAVLLPVFLALADTLGNPRLVRALALLFPSVILLSACGSLTGAGAHVIALETIANLPDQRRIEYLDWMLIGLPVALATSHAAAIAILHLFLTPQERMRSPLLPATPSTPMDARQIGVIALVAPTIVLWAASGLHGIGLGVVGIGAALVLTLPFLSGVSLKIAVRSVEWDLVLFLAASILIGDALAQSGVAAPIADRLLAAIPGDLVRRAAVAALAVTAIAMLGHLVIVSRTARAAVLIPAVTLPMASLGYDPVAVVMLCAIGTGFSQTFMVSSKALILYGSLDRPTFSARDLMVLSLVLFPVMLVVMMTVSLLVWPQMGLSLVSTGR